MDAALKKFGLASIGKTFRGDIIENAKRFRLVGKAYDSLPKEQDGYFDIKSAQHLSGVLAALFDPAVREVGNIGASQVLKSVAGDVWTAYVCEHVCRNMLILFEDDPKAKMFWESRLEWTIKNHPSLSRFLEVASRHAATTRGVKFPNGMKLEIGGLNDGNVSSLSWPIIWISELWQHKSDGLGKKARERADRFPNDKKIYCESRAGMAGEDLHRYTEEMVRVDCKWACPYCGGKNIWEFEQLRPDDFRQRDTLKIQPGIEVKEIIKPGSYAGMRITDDGTIEERARASVWECFHCASRIEDTKPMRQQLMDTYEQNYKVNGVSPEKVCFFLPKECARDNSFRASSLSFLTAQLAERMGNMTPMEDWYMSERAIFYDPKLSQPRIVTTIGSYDPNQVIEDEHSRGMLIDCQKHKTQDTVGTFWYEVYAANKKGDSFQLDRGFVDSWETLRAIQKKWKIPNHYVCIDGRKWTPAILDNVASFKEWYSGKDAMKRQIGWWQCWWVFLGDAARNFPHEVEISFREKRTIYKVYSKAYPTPVNISVNGKTQRISISIFRWSNLSIKDQLQHLRIGGEGLPKFVALPRTGLSRETQLKEVDDFTYDMQMTAEVRTEKNGKVLWEKIGNRQNHYWDLACMRLVRMAMDGLASHVAL